MIFCQELQDPKRNYENQIWTYRLPKEVIMEKNFTAWIWTLEPFIFGKYFVTGPSMQMLWVPTYQYYSSSIQNYQGLILSGHFTGLADLFPQLES